MTWAINEPKGEGEFWVNGDYVGWEEALQHHFDTDMSDAEREAVTFGGRMMPSYPSEKFTKDLGPLTPQEQPKTFGFQGSPPRKLLGSLIKLTSRLLAVDQALKTIIETIEPDKHQMWPIRLQYKNGDPHEKSFFGLVIGTHLNAFDPDASDKEVWHERRGRFNVRDDTKKYISGLALRTDNSAHLWREKKLRSPNVFISDALHDRIVEAKLRLPKMYRVKDI